MPKSRATESRRRHLVRRSHRPRAAGRVANPFGPLDPAARPAVATFGGDVGRGAPEARARLVQEWLGPHGIRVRVDGDHGGGTAEGVRAFQERHGLPPTGTVDRGTFERLVAPMAAALRRIDPPVSATLGQMTVAYAKQHLAQRPREVGGENMGLRVRLYLHRQQGPGQLWCAGFATFVQRQAAATLGVPIPIAHSVSCDDLAHSAQARRCFSAGCPDFRAVTPGSFFLVRKTPTDWQHVGIATRAEADAFHTIEGNTNDEGSREGFEVCARVRRYEGKDFILVG